MIKKSYYISTASWTACVETEDGKISTTPPLLKKFTGQPLANLVKWASGQRGYRFKEIS